MASTSRSQDIIDSAPPPSSEPMVFARHYRLETVVASGPWTAVWRATDERTGETVALKFFPPDLLRTTGDLSHLRDVLAPVRVVGHDGIVAAREVVTSGNYAAIITPWIEGQTLAQLRASRAGQSCDVAEVDRWMRELVEALVVAEERGVVHGALNPHVIFLRGDGRLAVSGFGINAWMRFAARQVYGKLAGSEDSAWLSPAQLRGEASRGADDVYAFGAITYELITGSPPGLPSWWSGRSLVGLSARRRRNRLPPAAIPSAWESIVQSCLDADESARLQSFREVRTRLALGRGIPHQTGATRVRSSREPDRPASGPAAAHSPVATAGSAASSPAPAAPEAPSRSSEPAIAASPSVLEAAAPVSVGTPFVGTATQTSPMAAATLAPDEPAKGEAAMTPPSSAADFASDPEQPPSGESPLPEVPPPGPSQSEARATPPPRVAAPRGPRGAPGNRLPGAYTAPLVGRPRSSMFVTVLLRGMVAATILAMLATGAWFGLRVFTQWEEFNTLMAEVREFPPGASDTQRAQFEERLLAAEERLPTERAVQLRSAWNETQREHAMAKVRAASLPGGIEVRSEPAGAQVSIGNRPPQPTPFRIEEVPPGSYEVHATLENHAPFTGTVAVRAGSVVELPIQLERPIGTLRIESTGDQLMYEVRDEQDRDPARRGFTPAELKLPQGRYRLAFPGGDNSVREELVEVRGNEVTAIRADPPPLPVAEVAPTDSEQEETRRPGMNDWIAAIDPSPFAVREWLPRPAPSRPAEPDAREVSSATAQAEPAEPAVDERSSGARQAEGVATLDQALSSPELFDVPAPPSRAPAVVEVEEPAPTIEPEAVRETIPSPAAMVPQPSPPSPKAPALEDPPATGDPLPELPPPQVSRPTEPPSLDQYNRIFSLGEVNVAPQLLERADPEVPRWVMRGRAPVRVELLVVIDRVGRVSSVRTVSATHDALIEPTLRAVRLWRFSPARKDNHAVAVRLTLPLVFRGE